MQIIKFAIAFTLIPNIEFNLSYLNKLMARRGLGSDPEQPNVMSIKTIEPRGMKLAQGLIVYNDGDTLDGLFRIYCPSKMIRPTNYKLVDRNRKAKKKEDWWEPAFKPKWKTEHNLINYTCSSSDI